jgi:DNA helicase-2/ATP-dependent DNA helicase PcrA
MYKRIKVSSKDNEKDEVYVFEFYDEDISIDKSLKQRKKPIEDYNEVDFENNLNEEQLKIINNIQGPMLVIAGAGSGKTRTIVYSVAKLLLSGVYPNEIMLVTFTNKAAQEMIKRVESLLGKKPKGIWAGTFHAMANRFIRKYAKKVGLEPNYTIMDEPDAKQLMKLSIDASEASDLEERFPTSSMAKSILSYSINCNKSIEDVIKWKYEQFDREEIISKLKEVFKIYKKKKSKDNLVDFDDLLVYWNQLLDERSIAQLIAKRIKYILVDEYQDTNYIQDEIIYKIVQQNSEKNVMVVGDDAQSIYAFRGANFENILTFPEKYANCNTYKITYNYRSVPEILELANDSIKHNVKQYEKKMKTTRKSALKPFLVEVGDDEDQARFIANQVLSLRNEGYNLNQMVVLCRAGFHTLKIELELQAKNIPYEVRAGVSFFERAHIKDLLAHLSLIDNPYDEISWSRLFSTITGLGSTSGAKIFSKISTRDDPFSKILDPKFFSVEMKGKRIPSKGSKNLKARVNKLIDFTSEDKPYEVIDKLIKILKEYFKSKYDNWQDRIDDLKQLGVYARNFETIRSFLDILSLNKSTIESKTVIKGNNKEEENPLIISTIHRAKGLEWSVVFIPMLCEDYFPSSRVVGDSEAFEEERRVFYVAVTRAKDHLYLISPSIVRGFRGYETARPSQFISELNPDLYRKSMVNFKSTPPTSKSKGKKNQNQELKEFKSALDLFLEKEKRKDEHS